MTSSAPLYLNQADASELERIPAIGAKAAALVEARPFSDWSDLRRAGLEQDAINAIRGEGCELGEASQGPIGEPGSGGSAASPAGNLGRA